MILNFISSKRRSTTIQSGPSLLARITKNVTEKEAVAAVSDKIETSRRVRIRKKELYHYPQQQYQQQQHQQQHQQQIRWYISTAFEAGGTTGSNIGNSDSIGSSDHHQKQKYKHPLATLKILGTDQRGILAAFSDVLYTNGCSIVQSEHYTEQVQVQQQQQQQQHRKYNDGNTKNSNLFVQRIVFDHPFREHNQLSTSTASMNGTSSKTQQQQKQQSTVEAFEQSYKQFQKSIQNQMDEICIGTTDMQQSNTNTVNNNNNTSNNTNANTKFDIHINEIDWYDREKRIAIFVSKYEHCLWELLLRYRSNELVTNGCIVSIPLIISNHIDCQSVADTFNIPYYVVPKDNNYNNNKLEQEQLELELLQQYNVDVVCLARYMQVLSPTFLKQFHKQQHQQQQQQQQYDHRQQLSHIHQQPRIINIHHSFLPAFQGGKAYHQAYERGVKLIGATGHYVTDVLDTGPIIVQDVVPVTHKDTVRDYIDKGHILERNVLVRAVRAHLENKTIVTTNNRCVVFG